MRSRLLYDQNQRLRLLSFDKKEQALAYKSDGKYAECRIFPSLGCDLGLAPQSALWGQRVTEEHLRAVSYYFGAVCGWPMDEITIEVEGGENIVLPLARDKNEKIPIKTKLCKQLYENIRIYSSSVAHEAVLFSGEYPFVFVPSKCPSAVDTHRAVGLKGDLPIAGLALFFGSVAEGELLLSSAIRGRQAPGADGAICTRILAYLCDAGQAEKGREYRFAEGIYRITEGGCAVSERAVSLIE